MMRFFICIGFLLQTTCLFAQSDHYIFSKLDIYGGLSHNQVTSILKDTDGFLWFGTISGLNRYDGYSFKIFRHKPDDSTSINDNSVNSLYELPGGKMWVGTGKVACIYDTHTEKFDAGYAAYLQSLGLPSDNIINIVKGNNGRYWFLFNTAGLYLYSGTEKKAIAFEKKLMATLPEKISAVRETKDDKLWVVYQNGLLQEYDLKSNKVIFSSTALQRLNHGNQPYGFIIDRDGDLWLWYFTFGVFVFHPADNSIREFDENSSPSKLNSNLVSQIVEDNNGLIWVATDHGGVNLIDKNKNYTINYLLNDLKDPKSLSHNSVTTIYKDDSGIIWIGTYKQGINYLNSNITQFVHYHHQATNANSLQYDDVNRFAEDRWGNIWIGTNGGGLIYFDRANNTFRQYLFEANNKNSLSNNVIVSLWIDSDGILWIGTFYGGLNSFDGKKFTRYRHSDDDPSSLSDDKVWEIFEDRERNLWIGTLGGGLDLFDRKTGRFEHYQYKFDKPSPLPSNYLSSILQDRKGNLWIGTNGGIAVFEKNKISPKFYQHTNDKNSLSSNVILCLFEDRKGRIWAGTPEGLNLFNEQSNKFKIFTSADGLPDNLILNILEDDQQTLWLSTPNGLCNAILNQNKHDTVFTIINYDEMNNLQNREFNDNAALKTRTGELIFGGPSGFNIIEPAKIEKPVYHPKIVFTGLQILNNDVEPGQLINNRVLLQQALPQLQGIDLKYKENVFSIEFSSLDFAHSTRDKYAYMLEGFNTEWLYADGNQRRVTYTNLDPGYYTFKVKVLSGGDVWSNEKTLKIYVAPPLWRTPAAYIIYALLFTGLLYLIRRITLDRIHMRFEVKQQRREAERAHALDQLKTKFFTNVSHEFRTPLSLIISPLDKMMKNSNDDEQKKQLNLVHRNAKRLLNLVNQLLDFRKMEVQELRLHPAIGDIIRFVKDISYSFSDVAEKKGIQFCFQSNVETLEIYFDKDKIEKILFNLLSNAYKYTPDNGKVSVHLEYTPPPGNETVGTLAIEVSDTGIGIPAGMHEKIFERFFQTDVPDSMVNQGTGIGLAITKEFVKLHNGVISVKSEPEKGTSFTVLLPANKINEPPSRPLAMDASIDEAERLALDEMKSNGKMKTILVVEDNEDLRFYLKDNLKRDYHVAEAINGKEGWEKVQQLNPDLVVSDIMMPLMDGIELARNIKTDTATAHIPVILLTAMGSEDKQLEGYKIGINDYITKPFTFEILASRITNLLAQQKLLQKRFQKQIEINPGEITVTPVDEKFMKQALAAVEKNMDNPDFSVEDLSREMNMSRVTLYRKILSLTDKPPLEFIRSIRLKRAAQLLAKSGMTIAEIAYEVGFNNPKVFSRFFKEEFKVTPSQYIVNSK